MWTRSALAPKRCCAAALAASGESAVAPLGPACSPAVIRGVSLIRGQLKPCCFVARPPPVAVQQSASCTHSANASFNISCSLSPSFVLHFFFPLCCSCFQIPSIPTGLFVSAKGEGCCLMQVLKAHTRTHTFAVCFPPGGSVMITSASTKCGQR